VNLIFVEHVLNKALAFDNWRLLVQNHRVENFEIARNKASTNACSNFSVPHELQKAALFLDEKKTDPCE